ncbi:hypothetical protein MMC26_003278 [Xylographa opegraphella]|nr:hypothetical protein [Xylographa opegraphella]
MRLRRKFAFGSLLVLSSSPILSQASSASSISLSSFQQIYGFSATCTAAYNTDIPGCTTSDFTSNNPCSISCISGLEVISALLNSACQGTEADPSTLIGLFFHGNGVSALCPNVVSGSTPQSSAGGQGGGNSMTIATSMMSETAVITFSSSSPVTTTASTSERPNPTTSTTSALLNTPGSSTISTIMKTTSLSGSPTHTPQSSSANISTSPSPSTTTMQSVSSGSSITQAGSDFTKTVVNDGTAVVLTSKPEQTASDNPDAFGGGGSPFEISNQGVRVLDFLWMVYGPVICQARLIMDTGQLAAFLEVSRTVARHSKITEQAAIIVCLVVLLAMISLLMLALWWLRVIVFLILLSHFTQMFPAPFTARMQALLHRQESRRAPLQPERPVKVADSGAVERRADQEDCLITRQVPMAS